MYAFRMLRTLPLENEVSHHNVLLRNETLVIE